MQPSKLQNIYISAWVNNQVFSAWTTQHSWKTGISDPSGVPLQLVPVLHPNFLQSHLVPCTHKETPSLCTERLKRNGSQDNDKLSHTGSGCNEPLSPADSTGEAVKPLLGASKDLQECEDWAGQYLLQDGSRVLPLDSTRHRVKSFQSLQCCSAQLPHLPATDTFQNSKPTSFMVAL